MYKKFPWLEEIDKFIQPSSMGMTQESPNFISMLQKIQVMGSVCDYVGILSIFKAS